MDFTDDSGLSELIQEIKEIISKHKQSTPAIVPAAPNKRRTKERAGKPGSFGQGVLSAAKADLGVKEDLGKNDGKRIREYFKLFNMEPGQDWCAVAVSTWMREAGGGPIAGGAGARNIGTQFAQANLWVPRKKITKEVMLPGNIAVWSRGGPGSWKGHIGVISSSNGNSFTSIEANSDRKSDSVVENSHSINDTNLLGIGILSGYVPKHKELLANKIDELDMIINAYCNIAK